MGQPEISFIDAGGRPIAARLRPGRSPTLFFLPGYASDMEGAKAVALDALADRLGCAMLRLDYSGTGSSGGEFADGTLQLWIEEALAAIDLLTRGPLVVAGSSMGGWIGLHVALRRPDRVAALAGIAAAPDFTQWGFNESQKQAIARDGLIEEDNPYGPEPFRTYRGFWESGQALRLLDGPIVIDCPVRLVHGDEDRDVPLDIAFQLLRRLRSADVQLLVIKGGGHRLSEPRELEAIARVVGELMENVT